MTAILTLGFLLGLQHAMEADHLAAVASLAADRRKIAGIARHGLMWGVGHALALGAFAGAVVLLRGQVPAGLSNALEFAVGVMLVLLGASVLYRLWKSRIHFHVHRHRGGTVHFHAHSHENERQAHDPNHHDHEHERHGVRRSLVIGMMHGLAGSAALIALSAPAGGWAGLAMIALFSLGSILGMVALSSIVALPLAVTGRLATGLNRLLQGAIGVVSIAIGGYHMSQNLAAFG